MLNRKGVSMAVMAAVSASASVALADVKSPTLSLEPTVATMQADAPRAPLMAGLDRLGAAKTLDTYGINIYGWVEGGYSYNHRHQNRLSSVTADAPKVFPGVFNHQAGDNFMFNQLVLRFERQVDTSKVDVGGMIEIMYGEDANGIHARGLGWNGDDSSTDGNPSEGNKAGDRFHPKYQFDVVQAYVDVGVGVKGLKFRAGKFVTLLGYEYINPNQNPFYSHSYIFGALPFTHTGVVAFYDMNDQWHFAFGVTRGWDIATEDNNGCAIDVIGQIGYTPNKQLAAYLNFSTGPQNTGDTAHYRTVIDPVITYAVTDRLSVGMEGLYWYDGGADSGGNGTYADAWGAAGYVSYVINDFVTLNGRIEKFHSYLNGAQTNHSSVNYYEATIGATIKPFPKDQWGSGLKIRPEVRYDFSDKGGGAIPGDQGGHKDQWTFGVDVIYAF